MLTYNIEESKRDKRPEKPSTLPKPYHGLVSLPTLVKSTERRLCSSITRDILHMFVIRQIENYHSEFAERVRKSKTEESKNQICGCTLISFIFLCLNYSSKKPPTHHHAGRNQSQTGTYLWILLLPERNSCCNEKKAHWMWSSSIILKPLASKQKQ